MNRAANPWRSVFRAAFVLYTLLLLTATHWPGMVIDGPVQRTDLLIHIAAFTVWTCLLYGACYSLGDGQTQFAHLRRRMLTVIVAGLCFAAFDEVTQPLFNRQFDWWDLGADAAGVLLGCGVVWAWLVVMRKGPGH